MTDLWLPDVRLAKIAPRLMDNTGRFNSPLSGAMRSVGRPGDRWGFRLDYSNLQGLDRARLEAFIANMRGAANRALYSPGDYVQRGSFPSAEIFNNNSFTNGVTGWSGNAASALVIDRALQLAVTQVGTNPFAFQAVALTAQIPYLLRVMVTPGMQLAGSAINAYIQDPGGTVGNGGSITGGGMAVAYGVSGGGGSNNQLVGYIAATSGYTVGAAISIPWCSLSRCALIDNGANLVTQSGNVGNTGSWTRVGINGISTGVSGAPDGTASVQQVAEDSSSAQHGMSQTVSVSASPLDYCAVFIVKQSSRSWVYLDIGDTITHARAWFNLATGVLGSTALSGSFTHARSFISNLGNGWFSCYLAVNKGSSSTSMSFGVEASTGDTVVNYTGTSPNVAFLHWECAAAQSSVPLRVTLTSSGSMPSGISQTGNAIYLKGLPASTNGLLLVGDWIEINKELKRVTAPLNSDAAGLGYLQFSPPLRVSPNDNDPAIVNKPMGRFALSSQQNGWTSTPLYFSTASLDLMEDPS